MSRDNSVLIIMHSRDIPECIKPLQRLNIDKVWYRGFTEFEIKPLLNEFILNTHYTNYILVSDDVIVTEYALDNILNLNDTYPIITGWCNLMPNINRGSVCFKPLTDKDDIYHRILFSIPQWLTKPLALTFWYVPFFNNLYQHYVNQSFTDIDEVWKQKPVFETYFVNWALTSMRKDIWETFPFDYKFKNGKAVGSDILTSLALSKANLPMYCARDSFVYHLATHRNFIIGKVKPEIIIESLITSKSKLAVHLE